MCDEIIKVKVEFNDHGNKIEEHKSETCANSVTKCDETPHLLPSILKAELDAELSEAYETDTEQELDKSNREYAEKAILELYANHKFKEEMVIGPTLDGGEVALEGDPLHNSAHEEQATENTPDAEPKTSKKRELRSDVSKESPGDSSRNGPTVHRNLLLEHQKTGDVSRRRVRYAQLEQLWEVLSVNKDLATGYNKTCQAREFSKKMWKNVAQKLNAHADGAVKDWRGWCKYWNDYKSKLKKLSLAAKASQAGGPCLTRTITDIEIKFLQFLDDDLGSCLFATRVDPLEEETQENILPNIEENTKDLPSITLRPVPDEGMIVDISQVDSPLRSSPLPPLTPPLPTLQPVVECPAVPPAPSSPCPAPLARRSPRRRRVRRDPPVTQDTARRTLIQLAERRAAMEERRAAIEEKRAAIEERNSTILRELLQEIKDIKQVLQSKSNGKPTDGE